ncbi:sulfite exporter TauE/SafE family protein [Vibrio sp.]|nr:sulfite exporter TauE/SafE family protein [Vibrio sp.]
MNIQVMLMLLGLGGMVGFMAGLLGIGGGLLVVPALLHLLPLAGIDSSIVMNIALATSLSTIIVTSGASAINHLRLGNVDIFVIKWLMPGMIVGGFFGANIVEFIPASYLPPIFGCIVLALAIQMLISIRILAVKTMPNVPVTIMYGTGIGVISSLAGIGGGSISVPFLNKHGIEMRRAVGSSSVCGCVIAIAGMAGFILHGVGSELLPPYSVGYVYIPALVSITATSMMTTHLGAKFAVKISTVTLKKLFAVFLLCIAIPMLIP